MYFKITLLCVTSIFLMVTSDSSERLKPDVVLTRACGGICPKFLTYFKNPFFIELGKYSGSDDCGTYYRKVYYYPRYTQATWVEARSICHSYNLELASFRTIEEAETVIKMVENSELGGRNFLWIFIDGIALKPQSKTDWYWSQTGERVSYEMPWLNGQPDTAGGAEYFLSIGHFEPHQPIGFNDIPGTNFENTFLCQKCN